MTGEQKPGGLEVVAWRAKLAADDEWELTFIDPRCDTTDFSEVQPLTPAEPAEARIRELEARIAVLVDDRRMLTDLAAANADRATAAEAKLARAVEGFGVITDLSVHLRRGGPDSSDLNDLSDALDTAVSVAAEALAALQQEGE